MIDTHAHLNFLQLLEQIDKVVTESQAAGVTAVIIGSSSLKDATQAVELAQQYPNYLYASVGIHPQKTDPENKMSIEEQLAALEKLTAQTPAGTIVALGETGLDFSEAPPGEETRPKDEQIALFQGHIKLAQKYNLPLIIHAREAVDEVIEVLSGVSVRGTFHCYAGGRKRIQKILSLPGEWYFGFDGNLTYDEGLQNTIKFIPENRILLETDSPFLTPVPHRGEVNTPANLPFIQEKINEIFRRDLTKQIVSNTQNLFGIPRL